MERSNISNSLPVDDSFVVRSDGFLPEMCRFTKLKGGVILFCFKGWADILIDLKKYRVSGNTQVILLPRTVLRVEGVSPDFDMFSFRFSADMFREVCLRMEPSFFRFLKENPCYSVPTHNMGMINGFISYSRAAYADSENRFRLKIAKNCLQNFILDVYDKCYRYFTRQQIEGRGRRDKVFNDFATLIREHCVLQREVTFYADKLCISAKYLTDICRSVTGHPAKRVIDDFVVLEIKVLLQSSELSVQEIADKLGFPDQSYLGRYFKRHEGVSPKAFRERY
ncbi:MAG: helix-turn-helix domain-containing protein [Bacteroidales bacterium]